MAELANDDELQITELGVRALVQRAPLHCVLASRALTLFGVPGFKMHGVDQGRR